MYHNQSQPQQLLFLHCPYLSLLFVTRPESWTLLCTPPYLTPKPVSQHVLFFLLPDPFSISCASPLPRPQVSSSLSEGLVEELVSCNPSARGMIPHPAPAPSFQSFCGSLLAQGEGSSACSPHPTRAVPTFPLSSPACSPSLSSISTSSLTRVCPLDCSYFSTSWCIYNMLFPLPKMPFQPTLAS